MPCVSPIVTPWARFAAMLLVVSAALAQEDAGFLRQDARAAEKAGNLLQAYTLYAQAAALDPKDRESWGRSIALRRRALAEARISLDGPDPGGGGPLFDPPSEAELAEAKSARPPVRLTPAPGRQSVQTRGDAKQIVEAVLKAFGLDAIFDGELQAGPVSRFAIEDVEFAEAARILEAATGTFLVPVSERLALVAKDTQQKRQELEHTMAVTVPIPEPLKVQEVQEVARSVQQLMDIRKLSVDSLRRLVVIRDRESLVLPAIQILRDLMNHKAQVYLEVEFIEVTDQSETDLGVRLPTQFPVTLINEIFNSKPSIPSGVANLVTMGAGRGLIGIGLAGAELIGTMSRSSARTLTRSEMRGIEGQAINYHIGDRFPVLTAGYFGGPALTGSQEVFTPPPTVNFEDLGVVLKLTPWVHGEDEVSIDVEAEYKVLTGQALNGIPVIANRKIQGRVRAKSGEAIVVAGLLKASEARTLSGLAGLSQIPGLGALFRQDSRSKESGEALFVIRPRVVNTPLAASKPTWTGSESRPRPGI